MYGRRYQRKRSFKRVAVTLLAFVMLVSVLMPGLTASAGSMETDPTDATTIPVVTESEETTEVTEVEETEEETEPEETEPDEVIEVEPAVEPQGDTPVLMERTVTASANGLEFSVTGLLTETTTLNVQALGSDEADYIRGAVLGLDDQVVGSAYDITLYDNGVEIQPGEDVEVSINGISSADSVYHLPHTSAADVHELTAMAIAEAEKRGVRAVISEIVEFFKGDFVPEHERVDFHEELGSLKFKANGFSVYYIASGNMSIGNKEDRGEITNTNTVHEYITMPGTTLYFFVNTNNTVTWTTTLPTGITGTSTGISYENHPAYQITIPEDFAPAEGGTSFTLQARWNGNSGSVKITVLTEQAFINSILNTSASSNGDFDDYPVYVAVLKNTANSTGIPAEPGQSGRDYNFIEDGYTTGTNKSDVFHGPNGNGIINPAIGSHVNLTGSVDGTNTIGLVDPTGVETKAMLTGINWETVKSTIFSLNETRYDTDGERIDKSKPDDYEVIPYVIKLETTNDMQGWHIDCAIRKKTSVTLTYDNNIPSGMKLDTAITLPNNVTTKQGSTVDIGAISGMNNGTVIVSMIQDPDTKYEFTFQGWNTQPDGKGTMYLPGEDITINENTTLYAIWNSNPALGTGDLLIRKSVSVPEGETIDADQEFTFTVNISNAAEGATYRYTIYNASNLSVSSGTIASGGTVAIKHSQYVIIEDVPAVNEVDGAANVTVVETAVDGYTPSWNGGNSTDTSTTVKIEGGRRSEVTCTNIMLPKKTSVTISKEVKGNMSDLNKEFDFTAQLTDGTFNGVTWKKYNNNSTNPIDQGTFGDDSVTFKLSDNQYIVFENVPIKKLTVTETDTAYTESAVVNSGYTDGNEAGNIVTIDLTSAAATISFTNELSATIDTGISMDSVPYIVLISVAVASAFVLLLNKRRYTGKY